MPDTFEWKIKKKMNERFARYIDPKRTDSENRFDDVSLIFFFFFFPSGRDGIQGRCRRHLHSATSSETVDVGT